MQQLKDMYSFHRDEANYIMDRIVQDSKFDNLKNIDICETGGATVEDLIKMYECFPEFDYIVVDYIQRIRGYGEEYAIISNAARELQNYARRTGKVFIICSQANRATDQNNTRNSGRPFDGSLIRGKGSGSIEEDADVSLTLGDLYEDGCKKIIATIVKNRYSEKRNIAYKYRLDNRLCLILENKNYV